MPLSTHELRKTFKSTIDSLIDKVHHEENKDFLLKEIQKISEHLEKLIQEKIQLLEMDFHDHRLKGDYLKTVTEGFDDLERLLRRGKTFMDAVHPHAEKNEILQQIKEHYAIILIPLLNIMAKLENDYISIATQTVQKKQEALSQIQAKLQHLKKDEHYARNSLFVFTKKKKLKEITKEIKLLMLKIKVLQLSLHHDQLNLYYFNHDHPIELREIKYKVDTLKIELKNHKEITDVL